MFQLPRGPITGMCRDPWNGPGARELPPSGYWPVYALLIHPYFFLCLFLRSRCVYVRTSVGGDVLKLSGYCLGVCLLIVTPADTVGFRVCHCVIGCLPVCLSEYVFLCLSVAVCLSICQSVCIWLSVCMTVCLSVRLSVSIITLRQITSKHIVAPCRK